MLNWKILWVLLFLFFIFACDSPKEEEKKGGTVTEKQPPITDAQIAEGINSLPESDKDISKNKATPLENPKVTFKRGRTDFLTANPFAVSNGEMYRDGSVLNAPEASMSDDSVGAAQKTSGEEVAPSGREGEVEEGDIFKVVGDYLFLLNTYKGLLIINIKDPKKPFIVSKLGIYGYPIEMYVSGDRIYAIISDVLKLKQSKDGRLYFKKYNISTISEIDIADVSKPKLLAEQEIKGQLMEGKTRKIDNTIYVVSDERNQYFWGWPWELYDEETGNAIENKIYVYSFYTGKSGEIKNIDKLEIFDSEDVNSYGSDFFISMTSNALMVAKNRYVYKEGQQVNTSEKYYVCYEYESHQESNITIIDISDSEGNINVHSEFKLDGIVQDQFKQHYVYNEVSKKAWYFGLTINTKNGNKINSNSNECSWYNITENKVFSVDITNGNKPVVKNSLQIGKEMETIKASLFADDNTIFAITSRQTDPLYSIDISDPSNLSILDSIDGLNGEISVFRPIENGKFLLGIGQDRSDSCEGFGENNFGNRVSVSIVDIRDLKDLKLVDRSCAEIKGGSSWQWSSVNWNYDQAHKMIGVYESDDLNLISVPFSTWISEGADSVYKYGHDASLVGVMTWNLDNYLDSSNKDNVLANRGSVLHPLGEVKRTSFFKTENKQVGLNLSDNYISLINLEDLNDLKLYSSLKLAENVRDIFDFGDYAIEQVVNGNYYWGYYDFYGSDQSNEFKVYKKEADLENKKAIASFFTGPVSKVIKKDNLIILLSNFYQEPNYEKAEIGAKYSILPYGYGWEGLKTKVQIWDLKDPSNPVKKGSAEYDGNLNLYDYYCMGCGLDNFQSGNIVVLKNSIQFLSTINRYNFENVKDEVLEEAEVLGVESTNIGDYFSDKAHYSLNVLVSLSLENPEKPYFKENQIFSEDYFGIIKAEDENSFYIHYKQLYDTEKLDETSLQYWKYFIRKITVEKNMTIVLEKPINIPGTLNKVFRDGNKVKFLTTWYQYYEFPTNDKWEEDRFYSRRSLHLLEKLESENKAMLLSSFLLKDWYVKDLRISEDNTVYILTHLPYFVMRYYYGEEYNRIDFDHLIILASEEDELKVKFNEDLKSTDTYIALANNNNIIFNLSYLGIIVVNIEDLAKPVAKAFYRTMGWMNNIIMDEKYIYMPSGFYGLFQFDYTVDTGFDLFE